MSENSFQGLARSVHFRSLKLTLLIERGEACRVKQFVSRAQWHVQGLCDRQHSLAARPCPPRLDKTYMSLRDFGIQCQCHLAHSSQAAPVGQQSAEPVPSTYIV